MSISIDLSNPIDNRGFGDEEPGVVLLYGRRGAGKSVLARALAGGDESMVIDTGVIPMGIWKGDDKILVVQHPHEAVPGIGHVVAWAVEVQPPPTRTRRGMEVIARVWDMRERDAATPKPGEEPDMEIRYVGLDHYWQAAVAV